LCVVEVVCEVLVVVVDLLVFGVYLCCEQFGGVGGGVYFVVEIVCGELGG